MVDVTNATKRRSPAWSTREGPLRVPEITAAFWVIKGLTTAMGESATDYLVHIMAPELAVLIGLVAFAAALAVQFRQGRYVAWSYWLAVSMVGIFGTMAADVLHVGFHVPYLASTVLYVIVLTIVFSTWYATEKSLSIHSIGTPRREAFYWATVVATFAMGTALGDFTAYTLHLGYLPSAGLFAVLITLPAIGFRWFRLNPVLAFWATYVITRPLGASIADGLAKAPNLSGLGYGDGVVALVFAALIVVGVIYLTITRFDEQAVPEVP